MFKFKKKLILGVKLALSIPLFNRLFILIRYLNTKTSFFNNEYQLFHFKNLVYFNLDLNDWIQNQLFFLNKYEDFELNFISENVKDGDVFVDIGANFGLYSVFCSKLVGVKGKVISFEPFSKNFKVLAENVKLNNIENIQLERLAVADKNSIINLFYDKNEKNLGMVSSYYFKNEEPEKVSTISLDIYLSNNKIDSLKYVKIDIEGGEYLALIGMVNTLKKFKPIVQIEINDAILVKTDYNSFDIERFFNEIGFEIFNPVLTNSRISLNKYSKNCFFRAKFSEFN